MKIIGEGKGLGGIPNLTVNKQTNELRSADYLINTVAAI